MWNKIHTVFQYLKWGQINTAHVTVIAKANLQSLWLQQWKADPKTEFPKTIHSLYQTWKGICSHHFSFHGNMYVHRFTVRPDFVFTCFHLFQSRCQKKKSLRLWSKPSSLWYGYGDNESYSPAVWRRNMWGFVSEWKHCVNRLFAKASRVSKRSSPLTLKCLPKLKAILRCRASEA